MVECLDIQERHQWKKKQNSALICKISLGLIFFTAKLSVQQHLLPLFTLSAQTLQCSSSLPGT